MSAPRAVLAGASGFIGTRLSEDLGSRGYDVRLVGRHGPDVRWGDRAGLTEAVDGAAVLINLAGRSVGCRYHDKNRQEIYDSRVETTTQLHQAVSAATEPPPVWMNASTATIYRHALDRPQTDLAPTAGGGEIGDGFSVDVARNWERTFFAGDLPGVRRVALRMAIVLGDGPALTKLATAARFGLGGPQLDGRWLPHRRYRGIGPDPSGPDVWRRHIPCAPRGDQKFSWIHLEDLIAVVHFILDHPELDGPVNVAAPGTATNRRLMAALRRAVHAPIGLPAPRWLLEPGMIVLGQESELVLKSRWVVPTRLIESGFRFDWPELEPAVADLV